MTAAGAFPAGQPAPERHLDSLAAPACHADGGGVVFSSFGLFAITAASGTGSRQTTHAERKRAFLSYPLPDRRGFPSDGYLEGRATDAMPGVGGELAAVEHARRASSAPSTHAFASLSNPAPGTYYQAGATAVLPRSIKSGLMSVWNIAGSSPRSRRIRYLTASLAMSL